MAPRSPERPSASRPLEGRGTSPRSWGYSSPIRSGRLSAIFVDGLFGAGLLPPPKRLTEGLLFDSQHKWRRPQWAQERSAKICPASKKDANIFSLSRISTVRAMLFIVADQFQEEVTSQVLRIMMLSRLMPECDQSGTRWFAQLANLFAAQPVRSQFRHQFVGNPGSTGLRGEESPYPLRT